MSLKIEFKTLSSKFEFYRKYKYHPRSTRFIRTHFIELLQKCTDTLATMMLVMHVGDGCWRQVVLMN